MTDAAEDCDAVFIPFIGVMVAFIIIFFSTLIVHGRKMKRRKAKREQREQAELEAWRQTDEGARVVQLVADVIHAVDEEADRRAKFTAEKDVSVAIEDYYQSASSDLDLSDLESPASSSEMKVLKEVRAAERRKIVKELLPVVLEWELAAKKSGGAVMGLQSISKGPNEPLQYARLWAQRDPDEEDPNGRLTWEEVKKRNKVLRAKQCAFDGHYDNFQNWAWDRAGETN